MIAVSFALPAESRDFIARLQNRTVTKIERRKIVRGTIDNIQVAVIHTGVGKAACEVAVTNFLSSESPTIWLSSGFAGALRNDIRAGELILGENFSNNQLLSRAQAALAAHPLRIAPLFTAATIAHSNQERQSLAASTGAAALDMETPFIAAACALRGIPLLSLRAVSDSPRDPFPVPPAVLFDIERQKTDAWRLARYLSTHPTAIWHLRTFATQIADARSTLTSALVSLVREL